MLPLLDVQLEWCFTDVNGYPSVGYGSFVRAGKFCKAAMQICVQRNLFV